MKAMSENTTSEDMPGQAAPVSRADVRYLARHQVMGLSVQFLLGMAVALIGQPSQTTGAAQAASNVLLGLHVLVAIALVAGAVMVIRAARGSGERQRRAAHWGAIMIGLTFVTGVVTMITENGWWSYAMAAGFIAALLLYGSLLVAGQRPAQQPG
jgi:hypothetical protein